jgi:four helix bundle protein
VITNIVEGYGRRVYKNDFLKFLVYSHASDLETINHLDKPALCSVFGGVN